MDKYKAIPSINVLSNVKNYNDCKGYGCKCFACIDKYMKEILSEAGPVPEQGNSGNGSSDPPQGSYDPLKDPSINPWASEPPIPSGTGVKMPTTFNCGLCGQHYLQCECLMEDDDLPLTLYSHERSLYSQAGEIIKEEVAMGEMKSQTVEFLDQNPAWHDYIATDRDHTFQQGDGQDADLGEFFARPVEIASFDWSTSLTFSASFNPWELFWENLRNINRLNNYYGLRADLKLKFLINGNGFYYGRLLVSYLPLASKDQFTKRRAQVKSDLVAASQRPHIFLDPTTSLGGEMTLPYVFYKNACVVPEGEWRELGEIDIFELNPLIHANGDGRPVRITVLAWAENVTLTIPTSSNADTLSPQCEVLDSQAGMMSKDEYGTGVVSAPSTIAAKAAGALANMPIIGPYARATQIAASAVAGIAKLFGYSRPAIISDIMSYKPTYVGNMANCNVGDTVQKLSVDAKQEVTIDPRTFGLQSVDEMTVKSIALRESYLTSFTWNITDTPDTILFGSAVTPSMWRENSFDGNVEHHLTPCAFASVPFRQWRGSMEFRFQIVSSNFHKGRLKVMWDPYNSSPAEMNVCYTRIVDVAENRDFVIKVKWGSVYPYLCPYRIGVDGLPWRTRAAAPVDNGQPLNNGYLCLRVLNDLTAPNPAVQSDIQVNVFVKMCDDFEVANPNDNVMRKLSYFLTPSTPEVLDSQAGEIPVTSAVDEDVTENAGKPTIDTPTFEFGNDLVEGEIADVCFGEVIPSFRTMLKRYCLHTMRANPSTSSGVSWFWYRTCNFPYYKGYAPNGVGTSETGDSYNYCNMTLLNYLTPAFVCWRGGLRHKLIATSIRRENAEVNNYLNNSTPMYVQRYGFDPGTYEEGTNNWVGKDNADYIPYDELPSHTTLYDGVEMTILQQNPVLEVEFPHQSHLRFYPAKRENIALNNAYSDFHSVHVLDIQSANGGTMIYDCVAAAEDFSLHLFTGCPVVYYSPTNPSPA